MPDLHVFPTLEVLARTAAVDTVQMLAGAIRERGAASLVLSGGSTPLPVYRHWAEDHARELDWSKVHVFWGDERCVPPDHEESNERAARSAFLDRLPIPDGQIHPMRCTGDPKEAVDAYAQVLRDFFADRDTAFDVTLLGLGDDGHTASLFPESTVLDTPNGWVAHAEAPPTSPVKDRVTLTFPALNASRNAVFLVSGSSKREALSRVLDPAEATPLPAARVRPFGSLAWYVDEAAYASPG